ncbi:putative alpha-mannosidase [Shigella flexneri]|nr:putative alpha-mannosidase [Shigella flexneri]
MLQLNENKQFAFFQRLAFPLRIFFGNDSNLLIVFYVQIMPDDLVMQLHRF